MNGLAQHLHRDDDSPAHDKLVRFAGATWADYQRLLEIRGDHSAPRLAYLEGEIEIMVPSQTHGFVKSLIGCLVETWCLVMGIEFSTYGSWTLEDKATERGAEPDECYVFGTAPAPRPHLAIEVIWTSGGLDKLEIYRKLGVPEVWIWRKGRIDVYVLTGEHFAPAPRSEALPGIDVAELTTFLDRPTTSQAMREYRAALEARAR